LMICVDYALVGPSLRVVENACIEVDSRVIHRIDTESSCGCDHRFRNSVALPPLCNAHIHVLDLHLLGYGVDKELGELVSMHGGIKYRRLESILSSIDIAESLRAVKRLARSSGILALGMIVELSDLLPKNVLQSARDRFTRILAQPSPQRVVEDREAALNSYLELLQRYDGVCLDTVHDLGREYLAILDSEAKRLDKLVQIHVAETASLAASRDYELLKGLERATIVHGTFVAYEEYRRCDLDRFHWVVCPRSNLYHAGRLPDPRIVLEQGARSRLSLGSDNVSWFSPSTSCELSTAFIYMKRLVAKERALDLCRALLRASTYGCYESLAIEGLGLYEGSLPIFLIAEAPVRIERENVLSALCLHLQSMTKYLVYGEQVIPLAR